MVHQFSCSCTPLVGESYFRQNGLAFHGVSAEPPRLRQSGLSLLTYPIGVSPILPKIGVCGLLNYRIIKSIRLSTLLNIIMISTIEYVEIITVPASQYTVNPGVNFVSSSKCPSYNILSCAISLRRFKPTCYIAGVLYLDFHNKTYHFST